MFRLYCGIFWGKENKELHAEHTPHESPLAMTFPLMFLAAVTVVAGFIPFGHFVSSNGHAYDIHLDTQVMLTSIVKRADRAVFEIVKATARGAFAGNEIITYDLANGGVDIVSPQVWARHAGVRLPAAIERRLAELRLELTRGGIRLPSLRDRTLCNCR